MNLQPKTPNSRLQAEKTHAFKNKFLSLEVYSIQDNRRRIQKLPLFAQFLDKSNFEKA